MRLVRVQNLLIVVLTQYTARVYLVGPQSAGPYAANSSRITFWSLLTDTDLFGLSLSTVCIAAAGYIINDYFDIKIDIVNKPERVVIGRYLKRRVAMGAHQFLNVLGCLIGLYMSRWVFVLDVVSVSLLWFYSAHFKRQPFIGNLIVSFLTALSLIVLAVYYRHNTTLILSYAAFSFCLTLVREIIKDMEDVKGDARFGCRTLPIVWGLRRTKYLLYVLIASFIMTLFLIADTLGSARLAWIFMILLLPTAWLVYRLVLADTKRDFTYLSNLCKLIMLMGVVSMAWV